MVFQRKSDTGAVLVTVTELQKFHVKIEGVFITEFNENPGVSYNVGFRIPGSFERHRLATARKEWRDFKSIDAAVKAVRPFMLDDQSVRLYFQHQEAIPGLDEVVQ